MNVFVCEGRYGVCWEFESELCVCRCQLMSSVLFNISKRELSLLCCIYFWSTEGSGFCVSGTADCERCPVPASLLSNTAGLGDLVKSVWLKPTQTFIYFCKILGRSCGRCSLRCDLDFLFSLQSLSIKSGKRKNSLKGEMIEAAQWCP